jgi:DNA-binding transcriptional LysR family regulator
MDFIFSLKVFSMVAETGKMTTAGESIFLTQPAVSSQIKSLEEFYGVKLFIRRSEGLLLTNEGQIVYSHAKKILQNFDLLNEDLKTSLKGSKPFYEVDKITIGSCVLISEIYMPPIIEKFMSTHPEVLVNCITTDYDVNIKLLLEGKVDIAFIGYKGHHDSSGKDDLIFEEYVSEQLEIVAPANFAIPNHRGVHIQFLMENSFIALRTECGISCIFREFLKKYNIKLEELKQRAMFCSGSAVKRSVISGFGWSILPRNYIIEELEEKKIMVLQPRGRKKPLSRFLYLAYLRSRESIPSLNLLLEFLRNFRNTHLTNGVLNLRKEDHPAMVAGLDWIIPDLPSK